MVRQGAYQNNPCLQVFADIAAALGRVQLPSYELTKVAAFREGMVQRITASVEDVEQLVGAIGHQRAEVYLTALFAKHLERGCYFDLPDAG